jgi:HEAT repeat protein
MVDSSQAPEPRQPAGPRDIRADERLPPVEPPSAAFLVQLFLAPAIIVGIIVSVWLTFHWLAHLGSDPQALVRTLRRDNEGRWQAALNLANDLRGAGGRALKTDATLAEQLGGILDDEVRSGRTGEQSQTLRLYLCRALGEFATPAAAGPLLRRAEDSGDPGTAAAAVEALAVLSANLAVEGTDFDDPEGVRRVILAASRDSDPALRSRAAFALGVVGGREAERRLVELAGFGGGFTAADASDAEPDAASGEPEPPAGSPAAREADVRYNAATALARLGRDEAYEPLSEMLALADPPPPPDAAAARSPVFQSRRYKRAMIVKNAVKAVALLVDATDAPPPDRIVKLVAGLEDDPVADIRAAAAELSKKLERLSTSGPAPPASSASVPAN